MSTNADNLVDEREGIASASRLPRLKLCPGSYKAELSCPTTPDSEDASRGKRIHDFCAATLKDKTPDLLAEDEELLAQRCLNEHKRIVADILPNVSTRIVEKRLWSYASENDKLLSGKCDVIEMDGSEAVVNDFKTGWDPVDPAEANLQMRGYAVLVHENFPHLRKIHVGIIQPNTGKPTIATYEVNDIVKSKQEIIAILDKSQSKNAARVAGPTQCKYCPAKTSCTEYANTILAPVPVIPRGTLSASAKEWSPEQRAYFCDVLPEITSWLSDRKEELKELAEAGQIPGWKVGKGRITQKCKDASKAFQLVSDTLDANTFAGCCTVSLPKLRKAYAKAGSMSELSAKDVINMRLNGLVEESQAEGSLEKI